MELSTNSLVEVNNYKPTPAEVRLLEVLANPEFAGKSVVSKCEAAGCSTPIYYAALKKPGFVALVRETAIDLVKDKLLEIVAATCKFAVSSPQNHQDRRILLEMGGLYREKTDINLNPDEPMRAQIMQMTDVQLMEKIQEFIQDNPELASKLKKNDM